MHYYKTTHIVKDRMVQNAFTELNIVITDRAKFTKKNFQILVTIKSSISSPVYERSALKNESYRMELFICCVVG